MEWCSRRVAGLRRGVVLMSVAGIAAVSFGLGPVAFAAPGSAPAGPGRGDFGINGQFALTPAPSPQGHQMSYFQLAVAPGQAVTAAVVVGNLASHAQVLALGRAVGVTAGSGGSAYVPASGRCSSTACWVTGLPGRVTLGPAFSEVVGFTVRVPPRTPPGQYLAGITAKPASLPAPVSLGSNGSTGVKAIVIHTLTVGVAITVGDRSSLMSRLSIRSVRGAAMQTVPRIYVNLYNTGQTFAGGTGQASCRTGGRWKADRFDANIVLPGDHALVPVNPPALGLGTTAPCVIRIRYGQHKQQVVSWSGMVTIPGTAGQHMVPVGKGGNFAVFSPQNGIPGWAVALIIMGTLLLALVSVVFYRQMRPRSR